MKKITLLIAVMLLVVTSGFAQAGIYSFAQSSGTYVPITGGTVITTATNGTPSLDSYVSSQLTFPTAFTFANVSYTNFYVTSDGTVSLGTTAPTTEYEVLSTSVGSNVFLAPFSADLSSGAVGAADIRWEQVGNEIVVQWTNFRRYAKSESVNFQARLNTVNGTVSFVYQGTPPYDSSLDYQPQVGIKSSTAANGAIALTVAAGGSWNTPTVLTTGITDSSLARFSGATGFTNGLTYTFTTPSACNSAPVGGTIVGAVQRYVCAGATPAAITVTGATDTYPGITYQWEQSIDNGANWANATGGTGATAISFTPPAYGGTPIQYRLKVTCANGATTAVSDVVTINNQVSPVTQASALVLGNAGPNSFSVSWTGGSGGRRLVYVSTSPITDPVSGTGIAAFTAATTYTSGQQIVYDGTGTSVTVTGLTCSTPYYVKVFEYSRCGSGPYDVYFNTTTGTNALTVTSPSLVTMPVSAVFTAFTNTNLGTASPGWYEATGDTPTGTTSAWAAATYLTVTTAKVNLYQATTNAWIISPKFNVTADSRIKFKAAITDYESSDPSTGMTGTDDKVKIVISTDCGATWTPIQTYDSANAALFTNALQDFIVPIPVTYNGQVVQIAFQATDGPLNEAPDYDFHIGGITVELIPDCDKPELTNTTNITKNTATINWTVPAAGVPTGYQYVVSTSNVTPVIAGTPVSGLTADVASLAPETTYYVFVRTVCGADFSDWSTAGTFTTLCNSGEITATTPNSRCGGGAVTIDATPSTGTVKWYATATGGAPLSVGASYSPVVNATTTFYAATESGSGNGIIGTGTDLTIEDEILTAFNNRYSSYKMQIIYTAAELTAAGLSAGAITSIGFNIASLGDDETNDAFTVKLGSTTASEFASDSYVTTGLSTVYGPSTYTHTASGWQIINFDNLYLWDGTSNIIVEVSHDGANASYNATTYYTPTIGNTILYTTGSTSTTGTLSTDRLNILFGGCSSQRVPVVATINTPPAFTLSGNPAAVCTGLTTAAVTVTAGAADYDTYVWTPSAGVTGDEATGWVFNPTVSTIYTLQASQSAGGLCNANPVTVNVTIGQVPVPMTIAPTGSPLAICEGQTQLLTATGGVNPGTVTLGDGTTAPSSTSYPNPFSAYYGGAKTQMLFKAAELEGQGLTNGGIVKSLQFDFSASTDADLNEMQIRIGSTTVEDLTNGIVPSGGLTTTYSGTYTPVDGATGYVTFTLATPYTYTGGNLIVEIVHNQGNSGNGSGTRTNTTETPFDSVYTLAADSVSGGVAGFDSETDFGVDEASNERPNIKFNYEITNSVVWTPQTGLYTDAAGTVAYTGQARRTIYAKPTGAATYTATSTTFAGCSVTASVDVTVTITPAPTVPAATQEFCNAGTVSGLVATGTGIKWYAAATGGTALAPTTPLVNNVEYFASQTVGGCESVLRTGRTAVINVIAAPTVADAAPEFCNAATVADLLPNGADIKWYAGTTGGTALASTVALVSGTPYYASQTVNGCEGLARATVTPVINVVAAPTVADAAPEFCNAATVADLLPNGADIKWYADANGGTPLASTVALVSGTPYYASQTIDGCEGLVRATVTPTINVIAAPGAPVTAPEFCNAATVADLEADGDNIQWYADANGGTPLATTVALVGGTPYYASQTIDGCESLARTTVTPTINVIAKPTGDDIQEFCVSATIADLDAEGDNIVWYDAETAGNVLAGTAALTDSGMYYASQTVDGCESLERFEVMATIYNVVVDTPANVSVCDDYELPALVNGAYYTEANGQGTLLVAGTEIEETTTLYVFAEEGTDVTCSAEHSFTVTVASVPAPIGDETQTISTPVGVDVTIEDLVVGGIVTGGIITWYASEEDAEDGENPLPAGTVLTEGATYYATQTVDTCTSEDIFEVLVDIALGRDGFDINTFTYHPNPVQNILNISYSSEITSVTVFNLLGQKVISQQANANDVKVDLSSLADGAYVVNVTSGNSVKTIKVIKKQ